MKRHLQPGLRGYGELETGGVADRNSSGRFKSFDSGVEYCEVLVHAERWRRRLGFRRGH